jgi:predicted CDP-diglyceride synthetase/phosphatidate cytidylyltransferase
MALLIIAEKIRLNDVPMPEDDVELRVRGIWMFVAIVFTGISSVFVFVFVFLVQVLFEWFRKFQSGKFSA